MAAVRRWSWGQDAAPLRRALAAGGVLAIPSESSYGLAADPRSAAGVEEVYALKGRAPAKPLPVVAADLGQLAALGLASDDPGLERAARLWPAPLTVVVPIAGDVELPAAAGGGSLGVRVPAHDRLRHLLTELGTAVTATSANAQGEPPILEPAALEGLLAGARRPALIVDDGRLPGGPPSTVVAWRAGRFEVLRAGAFPAERLRPAAATVEPALP